MFPDQTRPVPRGYIDLQVNGYGGINFSDPALSIEQILEVTERLWQRGTAAFCPTVITSPLEVYERVLPCLARAIESAESKGRLLGIHLEGPYISPEDGARGAHPRPFTRLPSMDEFERLYDLAGGHLRLLTLAPELPGALELIRQAVSRRVVVGIGHTLAGSEAIRVAVENGARLSTHLGNGCPNLLQRHHNPLWPQLANPDLTAMLITDGHHLPPDLIKTVLLAKGAQRVIVTSDSAPVAGLPPGDYDYFGGRARLEPGGRLHSLEGDMLAGSSATMGECMQYLASLGVLTESELEQVGYDNPLAVVGG